VVTTGGSIAHELNAAGIPWVVASQFPLWMRASTIAVDILYGGLLRGEDPRSLLYHLRKQLRTHSAATHDWASIVAYASVREDFEQQLTAFRDRYVRSALEVDMKHAEQLVASGNAVSDETEGLYDGIRQRLKHWCAEPASDLQRSERLGMLGATEKRIGNLKSFAEARADYERARDCYRRAHQANPFSHWVMTQYLSMVAIVANEAEQAALPHTFGNDWIAARQLATWALRGASGEKAAWALGTLAELELLGSVFAGANFDEQRSKAEIERLCARICEAVTDEAFPVFSTRRQFERYVNQWHRSAWDDLAKAAVRCLPDQKSWAGRPYLPSISA
jgi:hypothetical protein